MGLPPERSMLPQRLKKRAEFMACSKGRRFTTAAFVLQAMVRHQDEMAPPHFGFTTTKKVGHAVERNRMRRRLREAVRLAAMPEAKTGRNYVLFAREAALSLDFATLCSDLKRALTGIERHKDDRRGGKGQAGKAELNHE